MSLSEGNRHQYRNMPGLDGRRATGPNAVPGNVALGGTTGGVNNYGTGRGAPVMRDPNDLRQWHTWAGTSQQRYNKTRLPGDRPW